MKKTAFILSFCLLAMTVLIPLSTIQTFAIEDIPQDVLTEETHNAYLEEALSEETGYASSISEYNSFLVSYFDNLTYNFGVNYKGSCGYIAISMLLSYYDTALSDTIIPEQYDIVSTGYTNNMIERRNSPGTLRDVIVDPSDADDTIYGRELSANDYYSYVTSLQNISLHSKLISIASSRGYYDFSDDDNPAGTWFNYRYNVLQDYLTNIAEISFDEYRIMYMNHESDSSKSDDVKQFAINQVLLGNPVLLSVRGGSEGHVVVAYDYNATTGELYCHMGWGANKTHVTPESEGYNIYKTALVIDFDMEHSHPLNYGVTSILNSIPTTQYYCGKNCEIITYNLNIDTLEHKADIHYRSSTEHAYECHCGHISIIYSHNLSYSYHSPTQHYKRCSECEYSGPENHEYRIPTSPTSEGHSLECVCGITSSTQEAHTPSRYVSSSTSSHSIYCKCGHLISQDLHEMIIISPRLSKCIHCGYVRDTSIPGQIIMGIEEEYDTCKE